MVVNPKAEIKCLASNIYYEGRGEPYQGRVAIANTTLNRLKHEEFPRTICQVVYQPGQFTWVTQEHKRKNPYSWYLALRLAKKVLADNRLDNVPDNTDGAISFHVISITPDWSRLVKTVTIGHHEFFRPKRYDPVVFARD
jgi:spore germination cell wall hydrolase CwlJ-like protein